MPLEIERKFLVPDESFKPLAVKATHIRQGYLSTNPDATVRIRITDDEAWITVKSKNHGATRGEWEYAIPVGDAEEMLRLCSSGLEKTRYIVPWEGHTWEIDEFAGKLQGLTVAEIELKQENENFAIPPFVGEEVTGNPYYYNSNLSKIGL
ncbi:MAG: CYTH domain-containing protein [Bacteroidales bacterium]|nr:CYTH domain-containing protein [Bacteroidales bacterium]